MGVGGPRVGLRDAVDEPSQRRAGRRPQPERAVHVAPRPVLAREPRDLGHGVDRAGVDLADLSDHDRRAFAGGKQPRQLGSAHAALIVGGHELHATAAHPEHPQRGEHRRVRLGADQDANRRGAEQAVGLDVPARVGEHAMARRGEAGEVRHLATGGEAHPRVGRQAEEVQQPLTRDLLRDRRRGADREAAAVLVPHRRQPVGGDGGVEGATDDEAEVPRALRSHQAGIRSRNQLLDHLQRGPRRLVEADAQRRPQLLERGVRAYGTLGQRRQVLGSYLGGAPKERGIHRTTLPASAPVVITPRSRPACRTAGRRAASRRSAARPRRRCRCEPSRTARPSFAPPSAGRPGRHRRRP